MTAREFACGEMVEGCRERPRGERGCAVAAVAEGGAGPQSYSGGGGGSPAAEFIVSSMTGMMRILKSTAGWVALVLAAVVLLVAGGARLRGEISGLGGHIQYAIARPFLGIKPETSWVSLGFYDPFETTDADRLPEAIRVRLDSLLDARVGAAFRRQLSFVHAVYANHADSVFQAETSDFQWRVFEYRVGYEWRAPTPGVRGFVGYVTLYPAAFDSVSIEFPPIRDDPALGRLVPLVVARDTAEAHGVKPIAARLTYNAKTRRLLYVLTGVGRDNGGWGSDPVAIVDAHSGQFIEKAEFKWIS